MVPLGVPFSLQIEDQDLVEFDLSAILDPFDSNQFMLCLCPWAMSFFQSYALSSSLLLHALFMSPIWDHSVVSTIFWQDNQKTPVPWEGNTV